MMIQEEDYGLGNNKIMEVFHILWTKPLDNLNYLKSVLKMQFISALTIEKTYGSISIATDYKGMHLLKELGMPYKKYLTNLENTKQEYFPAVKIEAQKEIIDFNQNFLYLDYDVFINKKINKKFSNIVQADEGMSPNTWGLYKYCKQIGINFTEKYNEKNIRMCNMGAFKSNKDIIYQYYNSFFENLNQSKNFINLKHPINFSIPFLIFLEQTIIYEIFKKNNILGKVYQVYETNKPMFNEYPFIPLESDKTGIDNSKLKKLVDYSNAPIFDKWFDTPANIKKINKTNYIHLAMHKNNQIILKNLNDWALINFPNKMKQFLNKLDKI